MPLLEFQCERCGEHFDEFVYNGDRSGISCPACGEKQIRQVFQGKFYTGTGTASSGCTGHCATCPGCHHNA